MARSERYIPPSDEELRRLEQARLRAQQLDQVKVELFRAALKRIKKADLIEMTLRIAQEEKASEWMLENELGMDKPVDLLVHDVEVAIPIATKVDERRLNYNFDYDWRAYDAIRRGLLQLVEKHAIEEAKRLALSLMDKGSCPMAASDEGLMQEEIESCLSPVISAVATTAAAREWALEMVQVDQTGCICRRELAQLAATTSGGG